MNEIMHSDKSMILLDEIDYSNAEQVEEQSAIRRDNMEYLKDLDQNSTIAAGLEYEIEEIARRFLGKLKKTSHIPDIIMGKSI